MKFRVVLICIEEHLNTSFLMSGQWVVTVPDRRKVKFLNIYPV